MTAPNGAILFNNSTGSDTTASGLGAANVYGSGASTTGSSAVVTGISTTGVSAGDLLWVQSSSGRQFSIIASVDSSTQVTCDDVFANTESGRTWAIGGKRATFDNADSRRLFNDDSAAGFIIETETDQSISSVIEITRAATVRGASETQRTVTQTANARSFQVRNGNTYQFQHLKLENTNASKTNAIGIALDSGNPYLVAYKCVFGDSTNQLKNAIARANNTPAARLKYCVIQNCTSDGVVVTYLNNRFVIDNCLITNNGRHGIYSDVQGRGIVVNSIIANNTTYGFYSDHADTHVQFCGNTFYGNGSDAININDMVEGLCSSNLFAGNAGYGINIRNAHSSDIPIGNAFFNNTSGEINGASSIDSITLQSDPFVDAANENFTVNSDTLKAVSYSLNDDTKVYQFSQFMSPVADTSLPQEAGTQVLPFGQWAVTNPEAQLHPLRSS